MKLAYRPVVLIVLDGFGIAPDSESNAISLAKKPFFDSLISIYPSMLLNASSLNVGLPRGEVGNSEVGHTSIGSGILKYQSLPRIDRSIETGEFFKLPDLVKAFESAKQQGKKIHLMGLIGNGGVHASQEHLNAILKMLHEMKIQDKVFIHAFLDGRDTARDLGASFVKDLQKFCKKQKVGEIATLSGRFYAMDRNQNWDRIKRAYDTIVGGQSEHTFRDPLDAVEDSYKKEVYDEEFVPAVCIDSKGNPLTTVEDGDLVVYFNFRADRARQLTQAFVEQKFKAFERVGFTNLNFITLTEYKKDLPVTILFPPEIITNPIAKVFSDHGFTQLHIAETEKYAHVTFFLNGLLEKPFKNEERVLVPSPDVSSYNQKPEMSAQEVTNEMLKAVKKDSFDFYAMNFANADMVGHTGDLTATVKAVETIDSVLSQIIPQVLAKNGVVFITADHGNAEQIINPLNKEIDKEHNSYPVPFLIIGKDFESKPNVEIERLGMSFLTPIGVLSDVAPTILKVAGLEIPKEMTGRALV